MTDPTKHTTNHTTGSSSQANTKAEHAQRCCTRHHGPMRWVFRILLILALIFGASAAFKAYRWHQMDEPQRAAFIQERVHEGVSKRLDLNTEQQTQLDVLLQHARSQGSALNLSQWRARAQSVVAGPQFDQMAAQQLISDATQTLQREAPQLIQDLAHFYDGLNAEQQAQLRTHLQRQARD